MSPFAHVTGWGMAVPENVMTNDDLAKIVDTNDEWIVSRTGIHSRHIAAENETTATLATRAAAKALAMTDPRARRSGSDHRRRPPAGAPLPGHGLPGPGRTGSDGSAGAFDLSAACTGFIFALNMATQAIRTGAIRNALVIGAETLSRLVNWEDRSTCVLFGDGAGAFVLQASDRPGGVLSCVMRSDGSGGQSADASPPAAAAMPATAETVQRKLHTIQMNGREVFRFATRVMASATKEAVVRAGLRWRTSSSSSRTRPTCASSRAAARGLQLPMDRFVVNIGDYGNTSTASIPIAVCEAVADGRIRPGDHLVMVGFGAGLTWGASGPAVGRAGAPPHARRAGAGAGCSPTLAHVRSFFRRIWWHIEGLLWGAQPRGKS